MDNPWATSDPWQPEPQEPEPVHPQDDWAVPWGTTPSSETGSEPSDHWEPPRQESEEAEPHPPAAPPEWLESLLSHCQRVSQELWPASESGSEGDWRSGFDDLGNIAALFARLAPTDPTLPPAVQFPATATAKAMNEALRLTRHLPVSARSPLSRLLASKGSLEWEKSVKAKQDVVPETGRVGWRVLEKEDRLSAVEESKSKRASTGFLSFWSRKASVNQGAPVEALGDRSTSPVRSSLEGIKSPPHPPPSRTASPPKASTISVPPQPPTDSSIGLAAAPAPSAVSRFLNRFSRTRSTQHGALALSSDDIEFLSDIVPSASDPPDEDNDGILSALSGVSSPSPLPSKLPPPIPPPPKQPTLSAHPSLACVLGTSDGVSVIAGTTTVSQVQGADHTPNVPLLAPPLSPKPAPSLSHTPNSSLRGAAMPTIAFEQPSVSIQQRLQSGSLPRTLSPLQKAPPLSLPPLLPPPLVSPPQTPRPNSFSLITSMQSSIVQNSGTSSAIDPGESDDEFSAFTSFPAPALPPFPSSYSDPPLRSPSPPSPPPRRTYDRTHYPSSSSTSSILSPVSQSSVDQLYLAKRSISTLDGFDDFVSASPAQQENRNHTPSPPPLPAKSHHHHLPRIDTYPSRPQYSHTPSQSFASPTVHTSLMSMSSAPSVSNVEHRRTQALVNHAASRGGVLWPNSPVSDEPKVKAIPPPPSPSSPPPMTGENFDLLGDGDAVGSGFGTLPALPSGRVGMDSMGVLRGPLDHANKSGLRIQPSPPPLPFPAATNAGLLPSVKPKQMGGLSAQDLSFFEGL